jgi:NADH-quinone oxidoreductase subunit A
MGPAYTPRHVASQRTDSFAAMHDASPWAHGANVPHVNAVLAGQHGTSDLTEYYRQYLAVGVFVAAAMVMVGAMLGVGTLLRPKRPQDEKYITYESGSDPFGVFGQQNVRYYIYALMFVVFDVETVFVFPWAVNADQSQLGWFGFGEIFVFVAILVLGLAYLWRKGLLSWA